MEIQKEIHLEKRLIALEGKSIVVTGGAGFIGSHLVDALVGYRAQVSVVDDFSMGKSGNLDKVRKKIMLFEGDISNQSFISKIFAEVQPEIVFHFASRNLMSSLRNPQQDVMISVIGLLNILEEMRKSNNAELIVHSSTGSVYGEPKHTPQTEDHVREPTSPYGVSKMSAEEYLRVWYHLYSLPFIGLRYYNVYGPRQAAIEADGSGVIPIFARRILAHEPLFIDGNGTQKRCFSHVLDIVQSNLNGYSFQDCWCDFYNIASDEQIDIIQLAQLMMETSGNPVDIKYRPQRFGEIMNFEPSIARAKEKLHFAPRITLRDGLVSYFKWLKAQ
jgi:UDP-glucose 4-epimerase